MILRSRTVLLTTVLLVGACAFRPDWAPDPAPGAAAPVALLTEGTAFDRSGLRDQVAHAVARVSGRRVLVLGAPASVDETSVQELAARLRKTNPGLRRYDWREPHCKAEGDVLTAVQRNVDAVYRVSLEVAERSRPLTEAERAAHPGGLLRALHLVARDTAREEVLTGSVAVRLFTPEGGSRIMVARSATEIEPWALTPRLDVAAAVRESLAGLPPMAPPQWEVVARRLVGAGCPFLALAVADARLGGDPALRKSALAAVGRRLGRRPAARRAKAAPAAPTAPVEPEPAAGDDRYSCKALCNMHMVQLCNGDKILWHSHRAKWEATPCGARRDERFLQDCYQRQWLSSTFREACLRPCEGSVAGRERLMRILRDAGCGRLESL
jgi:hypothetical protein